MPIRPYETMVTYLVRDQIRRNSGSARKRWLENNLPAARAPGSHLRRSGLPGESTRPQKHLPHPPLAPFSHNGYTLKQHWHKVRNTAIWEAFQINAEIKLIDCNMSPNASGVWLATAFDHEYNVTRAFGGSVLV